MEIALGRRSSQGAVSTWFESNAGELLVLKCFQDDINMSDENDDLYCSSEVAYL